MRNPIGNVGLAAFLGLLLSGAFPSDGWAAPVFPPGLTAGGQELAGMTADEAREAVQAHVDSMASQPVTLDVGGQEVASTAKELGFHWANPEAVDEAADTYAGGSLIRQYMIQKDLSAAPVDISLETGVDGEAVRNFVQTQCQGLTAEPQNASITRENGQFVITDSSVGQTVDIEATEAAINEALQGGPMEPVFVTASITQKEPDITTEALATIQDVLGTYTTDFSSSGAARSTNLTVGAAKINGHVLMPGEVLSGYECLQPFTTANGYKTAAAYENGQVVDSIGGGVCQIATTLYNAALESEVEIVQRQNHSMIVTYVPASRDAAIAGTYKDIKIKNNYSTPIYVEGYTAGKKLTFTIYGKETRPANRKVEYVSETLGTTSPGEPQLIVDNSLAPGAKVRVQSAHTGKKSRLWKVVTVDGVEQERTLLNKDTYNASKAIYRVGPELPAAAPVLPGEGIPTEIPPAQTEPTPSAPVTGDDGGPGVSGPAGSPGGGPGEAASGGGTQPGALAPSGSAEAAPPAPAQPTPPPAQPGAPVIAPLGEGS